MDKNKIIDSVLHTSMAMPRDIDFNKIYYHGTSDKKSAEGIFQNGIQPPDLTTRKKTKGIPVKGKVYLTPDLKYAIIYALGGDMASHDMSDWDEIKIEPYGYVFVIDGKQLKDIQPDEDGVGEILNDYIAVIKDSKRPEGVESKLSKEKLSKLKWLDDLAMQVLTRLQYEKVRRYDDYMDFAVAGKKLVQTMQDWQKLELIDAGAHIAHTGKIDFKECWRIDKRRSQELKKDGSNFFEIAEKIK